MFYVFFVFFVWKVHALDSKFKGSFSMPPWWRWALLERFGPWRSAQVEVLQPASKLTSFSLKRKKTVFDISRVEIQSWMAVIF